MAIPAHWIALRADGDPHGRQACVSGESHGGRRGTYRLCDGTRPDQSAADHRTACRDRRPDPDHVRDRFQLSSKCPGDETDRAIAVRRSAAVPGPVAARAIAVRRSAAVPGSAVRGRNAKLRRALSDQLSYAAATGWTSTLRRPGNRNPLCQRRSVEPDGECRFRIFVRRRRDLCAVGELTRNRPGRAAFPPADMRTNAMRPSPLAWISTDKNSPKG